MAISEVGFFDELPRETDFERLTQNSTYHALPVDWIFGVADVVDSTGHVAAGRYKAVNMVGAAVISAVMNANPGRTFPFVFGGDGAGFAIASDCRSRTAAALAAVCRWASTEFKIELRAALVPVAEARAAGFEALVARFQVSEGADYAMFSGGGLLWAEAQMKAGRFLIEKAPPGTAPDLTGLSCRWANMKAKSGTILSLVVAADPDAAPDDIAAVYREIVAVAQALDRGGHPAPATGMQARWAPGSARLEGHVTHGTGPIGPARRKAAFESLIYWLLHRMGLKVGGFDARHYARVVAANADFRKLDDGLKMTLDCDPATQVNLETVLSRASAAGLIRYGISTQDEAMMTCIVPSIMTDDHLHFIDGAAGGYTKAATMMKAR